MENKKTGFTDFMEKVKAESPEDALKEGKVIGAIVANCNPFTLGHRYLIETALKQCDYLHLFVLSDKRTFYSASERYEMVKEGVKDLDRVILHQTSDYIISAATFPTYFMKEKQRQERQTAALIWNYLEKDRAGITHYKALCGNRAKLCCYGLL